MQPMKADIHPQIFEEAQVICSCGNVFTTASTKQTIHVEVCSVCHPYFTGEHRFLDSKGRVDTFQKRMETAKVMQQNLSTKKDKKKKQEEDRPKTLRELLSEA